MQNVKIDRHKFLGGSDIPTLLGINPYKTYFDLLLEKTQYKEQEEVSNEYIDYGNVMEEKIRAYINQNNAFIETKRVVGGLRYHSDGFDGKTVLEIKTCGNSKIRKNVNSYQNYLCQLIFGMWLNEVESGKLAVYERPKDFDETFIPFNLTIFDIEMKDYKDLLENIKNKIEKYYVDLEKVKNNPFILEEEL